jgi:nitrate reductase gamma subunit
MPAVQIITYISLIVSFAAMLYKAYRYATAPEAMRWELYPVPHEKGRSSYGGSYLEELDWWTKPRHSDTFNEIKEMGSEIIFLKGVFHHKKILWYFTFPFHFGLYVTIGWLLLLLLGAVLQLVGVDVSAQAGGVGGLVHAATIPVGYIGLILAGLGALGLFFWRLGDKEQRRFNAPIDYFNLLFFVVVTGVTLVCQLGADPSFVHTRAYVAALVSFSDAVIPGGLFATELVLISLIILYIPLTRMSHFVAKYFLYHAVRWNDKPNPRGSKIEGRIVELLGRPIGWSAGHIQTGKSWGEVAKEPKND